jgi:regulator of RNase E activity RraA
MRGGRGAIVDGAVRDIAQMRSMDFPCFALHRTPKDSAGRQMVDAFDVPIEIGGVAVTRDELLKGRLLREVYDEYGVL